MSFKGFIYYCACCGGWTALMAWGLAFAAGLTESASVSQYTRSMLIAGILGLLFELPKSEWLPRTALAVGLAILGLCIGLLIGLAQVILKEAWLRVESGFRPGRELILSKTDTTLGRAESCDIGLFGDPEVERV